MDQQTLAALGEVKIENKSTGETKTLEVQGFDVLGMFLPFWRLLFAKMWKQFFIFLITCWAYPVWMWYLGFNFKKIRFQKHLNNGWTLVKGE